MSAGTMSAYVDGFAWVAGRGDGAHIWANLYQATTNQMLHNVLVISGGDATRSGLIRDRTITITLVSGDTTGTYALGTGDGSGSYSELDDNGTAWGTFQSSSTDPAHQGTVVVTQYDPRKRMVAGTFSFATTDYYGNGVHVTEGHFSVHYSVH